MTELEQASAEIHHLQAKLDDALDIARKAERLLRVMAEPASNENADLAGSIMEQLRCNISYYAQTHGGLN